MGKIAFISSLLLFLAFLGWIFWKRIQEKGENEREEEYNERVKNYPLSSIDGGKIFMVIVIIAALLLAGWFAWWAWSKMGQADNNPPPPPVSQQVKVESVEQKTVQRGTLSWRKEPGYEDKGDPNLRSFSSEIVLHRNDSIVMEFTSTYEFRGMVQESHFRWNKREDYGTWYQKDPESNGSWWLEPSEDGKVWTGWIADGSAVHVPLELKL